MQPTGEEIRAQLERLLASQALASSARLRRFLRYVVERTLEGEGDRLKEYAVGMEVFDRGEQYDPRIDSIVRVEAGRLRAKLGEYYNGPGVGDHVIVRIPRGSYTPIFERRPVAPLPANSGPKGSGRRSPVSGRRWPLAVGAAATAVALLAVLTWRLRLDPVPAVTVAVLPFAHFSADPAEALLAARITDGVTGELVRNAGLAVVSRTSTLQFAGVRRPLKEVARALNANMVVEASVLTEGDRVRIQARIVDPVIDRKVSLHEFEGTRAELDELQRRIAAAITTAARPLVPR